MARSRTTSRSSKHTFVRFQLVVMLAISLLAVGFAVPASAQSVADIATRDHLIADQENLLNIYRCRFRIDLKAVPGGCSNRRTVQPGVAPPNPTRADIEARDNLIRNQEALLNIYRCRFGIDTQVVPGGCVDGKPAEPPPEPAPQPTKQPDDPIEESEHPANIAGWVLDVGDDEATGPWWSYDLHVDPDNPATSPLIAAGCADNNSAFYLVIWSDTPVAIGNDEKVDVSIKMGTQRGEVRWRASNEDGDMYLGPADGFAVEMLAAGAATLRLTVTDDDGQKQSFAFDLSGFREVMGYMSNHCPVPLTWQLFEAENADGGFWGYSSTGTRADGTVGSEQALYAVCYADDATFTLVVISDTPVVRSANDESVTVVHRIGTTREESRWWAADDDEQMVIYPPSWIVAELAVAEPLLLNLEITDANGRSQYLVFNMSGFATSVEQMTKQCPVPSRGTSDGAITVPAAAPTGRCASSISAGVYQWEQCAWAQYWEDRVFNRPLSEDEADALIARIWEEVDVVGKRPTPPTSTLVPAGSECATSAPGGGFIIGCYLPHEHHIRRLDAFAETLLHEVAHALLVAHPSIGTCRGIEDYNDYQACVHNDIFRCVADHLYTTYAGIPTAGVCGTTSVGEPDTIQATNWQTFDHESGLLAVVEASWHTRPSPYEDSIVALAVRCSNNENEIEVFFFFEEGALEADSSGGIPVAHLFISDEFNEWGADEQSEYVDDNRVDTNWSESRNSQGAFLPDRLRVEFINDIVDFSELLINTWYPDDSDFGLMSFSLEGAYEHVKPVTEECGWIWS